MILDLVGPGRLGRSLAPLWRRAGHDVVLHGRDPVLRPEAEAVILMVPDRAIASVAAGLTPGDRPVLHTSGATDLDALRPHPARGSLHPLMTFPGPEVGMPPLDDVPAAVDGTDEATVALATDLARDLGMRPVRVPGDRRLYHASAVIAGNFATVLLAEASAVLAEAGLSREEAAELLVPLATTSLRHALPDPARALTGPVARGDDAVLDAHRAALAEHGLDATATLYDHLVARARALPGGPHEP